MATTMKHEQSLTAIRSSTASTNLIRVDDAVEVGVGHAVTGQLEVALHVRLFRVCAVDRVQLVERRLKGQHRKK